MRPSKVLALEKLMLKNEKGKAKQIKFKMGREVTKKALSEIKISPRWVKT